MAKVFCMGPTQLCGVICFQLPQLFSWTGWDTAMRACDVPTYTGAGAFFCTPACMGHSTLTHRRALARVGVVR